MNVYFSIDIETNGLAAGINSMISLGAAAIDVDSGTIVSTFKRNLKPILDLAVCEDTMNWWKGFPAAYKAATDGAQEPEVAMRDFVTWVKEVGGDKPVGAAWKPGFDMAFVRYYLHRFANGDVFGRAGSGLDIKTLTAIALGQSFSQTQIATVPQELKGSLAEHSHDALEDAIEQAYVLHNARKMLGAIV